MSETKKEVEETQGVSQQGNDLIVSQEKAEQAEELANVLDDMDELVDVTSEYLKITKDFKERFVFIGMTEISAHDGDGMSEAVRLLDGENNIFTNASAVLVGSCKLLATNTPIQIEALEEVKGKKGAYFKLRVSI